MAPNTVAATFQNLIFVQIYISIDKVIKLVLVYKSNTDLKKLNLNQ